jgi:hypothetical protein
MTLEKKRGHARLPNPELRPLKPYARLKVSQRTKNLEQGKPRGWEGGLAPALLFHSTPGS